MCALLLRLFHHRRCEMRHFVLHYAQHSSEWRNPPRRFPSLWIYNPHRSSDVTLRIRLGRPWRSAHITYRLRPTSPCTESQHTQPRLDVAHVELLQTALQRVSRLAILSNKYMIEQIHILRLYDCAVQRLPPLCPQFLSVFNALLGCSGLKIGIFISFI